MIISIDPGMNCCGIALWDDDKRLHEAFLVLNSVKKAPPHEKAGLMAKAVHELVIAGDEIVMEVPQVYCRSRSIGDPEDLINLSLVVGMIIGGFKGLKYRLVKPREWKGTVKKEVMTERIKTKLSKSEHDCVRVHRRGALMHNVWDGIGIGLFHLNRL